MIFDKLFKNSKGEFVNIIDILLGTNNTKNYIHTMAEAHAIDLIAKTISKCEIQTFEIKNKKVEETKGKLYWTLNIQPNFNEHGTKFIYKLMTKLLTDKTALVIIKERNGRNLLYVADSYNSSDKILYGKTFNNIYISDDEGNSLKIKETYTSDNTIYYSLKNTNLNTASENFKTNISKILNAAQKSFISANTRKWRLKYPGTQPALQDAETKKTISYEKYKEKITEGIFSEEDAVVLMSEVFDLINLNKDISKNLTDFDAIVKDIGDNVAQKWNIPLDVFYGTKTEKSTGTNDFITFGVDPYFELLEDGFNASLVGEESFLKGEYVKINRTNISHKDVLECGTGIDKLTANRFSRNEINKLLKLPNINEKWADEHHITKNYTNVKGGAENGK